MTERVTWRQQADTTAVIWKYGYDPADQLISAVKHATDTNETILKRYAYAYDPAGNRTVEQIDDVVTLSAYDNLNRLTSQAPGGPMIVAGSLNEPGTVTISGVPATVDANNNFRGTVPTVSGTNTFTVVARDASGNVTTQEYEIEVAGSSKNFTYDANGNQLTDGTVLFHWNARNQLVSLESENATTEWTLDGAGRRVGRTEKVNDVMASQHVATWLGAGVGREVRTDAVGVREGFQRGERLDGVESYFVTDHLGSLYAVTDESGDLVRSYSYEPFGVRTLASGSGDSVRAYAGTEAHVASGLLLATVRTLDPRAGRWTSEDSFVSAKGIDSSAVRSTKWGRYPYVRNNPVRWVDPLGLVTWDCLYMMSTYGEIAGAGQVSITCESECVGGRQVVGNYVGTAVGLVAGPLPFSSVSSQITLEDNLAVPQASSLAGRFLFASVGVALGPFGYSYTTIEMGAGRGRGAGAQGGVDLGGEVMIGAVATVASLSRSCC